MSNVFFHRYMFYKKKYQIRYKFRITVNEYLDKEECQDGQRVSSVSLGQLIDEALAAPRCVHSLRENLCF